MGGAGGGSPPQGLAGAVGGGVGEEGSLWVLGSDGANLEKRSGCLCHSEWEVPTGTQWRYQVRDRLEEGRLWWKV